MPTAPESFPRLRARTQRFTLGDPRSFTLSADGRRLLFLRAAAGDDARTGLWAIDLPNGAERPVVVAAADDRLSAAERARRERVRESASGVVSYSADDAAQRAAYAVGGALYVVEIETGEIRRMDITGEPFDPRLDPTGQRVGYVSGRELRVVDLASGEDRQLAVDPEPTVSWGRAEFVAAEEMNRTRGYWWGPDGQSMLAARVDEAPVAQWWIADPAHPESPPTAVRYPAAGAADADVSLWWLGLDGATREVRWDRAGFPYLCRVTWSAAGPPLVQVVSPDQRATRILEVDVASGATTVLTEDDDPSWIEVFDGVPAWYDGRLVRIADRDGVRALIVGTEPVTPAGMYVRSVCGVGPAGVTFTASTGDPTQVSVHRWSPSGLESIADTPGVHHAVVGGDATVVVSADMDRPGPRAEVRPGGAAPRVVTSYSIDPVLRPAVRWLTLGRRELRAGLVLPRDHSPGTSLPVLMDPYGGPAAQRVMASSRLWLEPQWLADQGFAVLVVDGRGTPGRDPAWDRAIHRDVAAPVLEDQVDALHAAAELEPDLDLGRVGIRGWSFGGYLAALAVLRRPEVFHAAVAGAPVTDWARYDTFYTERYLGTPQDDPEAYARASLLDDAPSLRRPLLLVHGLADDNVVAAHTLGLSQRLTEAGRPHTVLPLTGVTHMTPQPAVAENLLMLQVEFLHRHLAGPSV